MVVLFNGTDSRHLWFSLNLNMSQPSSSQKHYPDFLWCVENIDTNCGSPAACDVTDPSHGSRLFFQERLCNQNLLSALTSPKKSNATLHSLGTSSSRLRGGGEEKVGKTSLTGRGNFKYCHASIQMSASRNVKTPNLSPSLPVV